MRLQVNTPCDADWDAMTGDERKRFCGHCSKHVHDLSALTEPEARQLLSKPDVCGRFRVRPDGHVRFRGQRATAAALVLSAVFASAPAMAGGKADPGAEGGWSDWIVEWLVGDEEPVMLGEIEPLDPTLTRVVEMGSPVVFETRTVDNHSSVELNLVCDLRVYTVPAGGEIDYDAPEDVVCKATAPGFSQNVWEQEIRCEEGPEGLRCDQS